MAERWSIEEEDFLREASSSRSIKQMAEHLGRTRKAVFYRCQALDLSPVDGRRSDQPKEKKKPPRFRIDDEGRECSKCGTYRSWTEYATGNGARGKDSWCKACRAGYHTEHWQADLDGNRAKAREAQERYRDQKLGPDRKRFVPCRQDEDGRECPGCRVYKPWAEIYCWQGRDICKSCQRENVRKHRYIRTYDITVELFEGLEQWQCGACALCGEPEDKTHPKSGELFYLSIDHDHGCGRHAPEKACRHCIRGLLCYGCNQLIGYAERRGRLRLLFADYLARRPLPT